MSFLTAIALRRQSVTVLLIIMVLIGGVFTFRNLPVELFPEIEFPLITVSTFYPSANPEAVVRDVTEPIENAILGIDGVESVQTTSSENRSVVLVNFTFGIDMNEAERTITSNISSIQFPELVQKPKIGRINPNNFPVIQLSILGDRDISELQNIVAASVIPAIEQIKGVFSLEITGDVRRQVMITVDPEKLSTTGLSLFQVSNALRENNVNVPAGAIASVGQTFPVRTTNIYNSLESISNLIVGVTNISESPKPNPVLLSDVATIVVAPGGASSVSRTNGAPSLGIGVLKDPDANTVDVTEGILRALGVVQATLPSDVQIVTLTNDGPEIKAQLDALLQEALLGFLFAIIAVFIFLINLRPTILRGLGLTLRPTVIITMSIPLSIFMGILLMGFQGMTLNFMTLGGLAIAIGRVVDDSIVVLENIYRHLQRDGERWRVALDATREVAPAITASTLTTIAVFVPLGFIQGLVGSFFLPFAMTVSFCLLASLLVSLTAVPVLGAIFLRPGDLSDEAITENDVTIPNNWIHRLYTPSLLWALRHRAATLITAFSLVIASLGLTFFIPVTLFPSDGNQFLTVQMSLPVGTSIDRTFAEVDMVEAELADLSTRGLVEIYNTTVGAPSETFGRGTQLTGGFNEANIFIRLAKNAPNNLEKDLRDKFPSNDQRIVTVTALQDGPPSAGVEIMITGSDYPSVSSVTKQLSEEIRGIDGIVNLFTEVATARDEIVINVDPGSAIALGLSARNVALQVNQYLVGQTVAQMNLEGTPTDIILRGRADTVNDIDAVRNLSIVGRAGSAMLGNIANVSFQKGPVSISRTNGVRSASIRGLITDKDTQAIGRNIQDRIDALILPLGVEITTGGIFNQIAEGFQDIFLAMAIGIALVYLVMVASLGSLRNPFIIVMSLPLALIGALVALLITGRTLGLPAMMGILILVGLVVTNAIVLIAFVEQLRERGASLQDALVQGGKVRLRPILMTAFTTSFALIPLAAFGGDEGGIIGAELATVVIGGLASSTFLTLIVVPVIYIIMHQSIPKLFERVLHKGNARAL